MLNSSALLSAILHTYGQDSLPSAGMAIGKWISFATPQPPSTTQSAKPPPAVEVSSADAKKFGLENFGNTCYANSVLQALYFCAPFRDLILQYSEPSVPIDASPSLQSSLPPPSPQMQPRRRSERNASSGQVPDSTSTSPLPIPSSPSTLLSALRSLFLYISTNPADRGTVAPRAFIEKLKEVNELFRSTMHQDAHEFLNYLLNKIVEEIEEERKLSLIPSSDDVTLRTVGILPSTESTGSGSNSGTPQSLTLVHKLFEGFLTSETRCLTCETISSRDEAFLDLSVDIEQNSSITACLRQFSASEMLCQKNKFFCDSCCDLQEAEKRMKIKKLPNVLALHLKRFKYQEEVQKYIKLAYRVAFPMELRLFNTADDIENADRLFSLFAIVVHIGSGPHHGHYISIVKTMGAWLVFDDDAVETIKENDIPKYFGDSTAGSAYVLYYQAVDLNTEALGLQEITAHSKAQFQEVAPPPDSAASPQQAPALPPGLGEESESSDSDPLLPVTPVPPPSLPPPHVVGDDSTVKVMPDDKTVPPLPLTPPTPPTVKGGFLRSLRRSPSTKVPPPLSIGSPADPNGTHPRHPTLKAVVSQENMPAVPPLPPVIDGKGKNEKSKNEKGWDEKGEDEKIKDEEIKNEKTKEKARDEKVKDEKSKDEKSLPQQAKEQERKANGWFHLISPKSDKSRTSVENPSHTSSKAEGEKSIPSSPVPSVWFRTSGPKVPPKPNQRPSEPGLFEHGIFNAFGILSASTTSAERRQRDGIHGYGSHSAASVASSTSVTPGVEFPSTSSSRSRSSYRSSLGPLQFRPDPLPSDEQDKGSEPRLTTPAENPPLLGPVPNLPGISIPPLDLNATTEPAPAPPPVPPKSERRAQTNGTPKVPSAPTANRAGDEGSLETWQKLVQAPQSSAGIGAFPRQQRSSISGSVSLRRASRKLSLTVPIPGFARRDKQKEQGKEKDKEREQRGREKDKVSTGSVVGYSVAARV